MVVISFYYGSISTGYGDGDRSNHRRCSVTKGDLKNFAKFTGKHLYWSLFFNKVLRVCGNWVERQSFTGTPSTKFPHQEIM